MPETVENAEWTNSNRGAVNFFAASDVSTTGAEEDDSPLHDLHAAKTPLDDEEEDEDEDEKDNLADDDDDDLEDDDDEEDDLDEDDDLEDDEDEEDEDEDEEDDVSADDPKPLRVKTRV